MKQFAKVVAKWSYHLPNEEKIVGSTPHQYWAFKPLNALCTGL
jgi:hypothetical protein